MDTMESMPASDIPATKKRGRPPKIARSIGVEEKVRPPIGETPKNKVIADGAFIIKETSNDVDPYTVKRTRVKFHQGICDECGKDLCEGYEMGPYDYLSDDMKEKVKETIVKHKELVHSRFHQRIIASEDMPVSCIDGQEITMRERLKQMAAKRRLEAISKLETAKEQKMIEIELSKLEKEQEA